MGLLCKAVLTRLQGVDCMLKSLAKPERAPIEAWIQPRSADTTNGDIDLSST